jgi:hypothetical protein
VNVPVICSIKALICREDTVGFIPPSISSSVRSSDIFQASAEDIISLIWFSPTSRQPSATSRNKHPGGEREEDIHFRSPSTHCSNHPSCFNTAPANPSHSCSLNPSLIPIDVSAISNPPDLTDSSNNIV